MEAINFICGSDQYSCPALGANRLSDIRKAINILPAHLIKKPEQDEIVADPHTGFLRFQD